MVAVEVERPASFIAWLIMLAFAELSLFGMYWLFASLVTSCGGDAMGPIGYIRDGQPDSVPAAALLGAGLWTAASVAVWRVVWKRGRIVAGVVVLYAVVLGVLWAISPSVWGPGVCPGAASGTLSIKARTAALVELAAVERRSRRG